MSRIVLRAGVIALQLLVAACGDGPSTEPDSPDGPWTAPPRKACNDDLDCADADECTWNERCEPDGFCAFRVITCDDFNECTSDSCDPAVGCVFENHTGLCDDENPCTLGDQCRDGACFPAEALTCDDDNPCTRDACDPETGACLFEPQSDLGNADCNDDDACTTDGRCDAGRCVYEAVQCPSDTQCSDWGCDPVEGCVAEALNGPCNDGDVCTTNDTCEEGVCVGGAALACADGDPCTDDTCDPRTGCTFPFNRAPCEDEIGCTANDRCEAGTCVSGPADCDDDNPCTIDLCDAELGCRNLPTAGACDDGNPCTSGEFCVDGACAGGTETSCDDGRLCTIDSCTPNGEVAICDNTPVPDCLGTEVEGAYFGLFYFGFDTHANTAELDCVGTATASLLTGATDVVTGSASCTWETSVSPNRAVVVSFSATDTGSRGFLSMGGGITIETRRFNGTLSASGALLASMPIVVHLTTSYGNPQVFIFADGDATAPPANQPKPVSIDFQLDLSDAEAQDIPLCCREDGACFPGSEAVCESVGAESVAPQASGECCIQTGDGIACIDTPASWCQATPDAIYYGALPSACCLTSGCALLSEGDCEAAGGSYTEGLGCGDADGDGFADACPAPPGCAQPGVATCTLTGKVLSIKPTGFQTVPLTALGNWTTAGPNTWTTDLPFTIPIAGENIPIPLIPPGLATVTCDGRVSITGELAIPDLGLAGFDLTAPEVESPTFEIGFGLGQDLASLNAPLSDCRTYVFFEGNSRFTLGSGEDQSVLNDGSQVTIAVDPFDPAFYAHVSGQVLDGPTGGLLSRVGFGVSRQGHLKWNSLFPVPPSPGRPPVGETIFGHVYATGDMSLIPIANSPVQIQVDGESVYDLGPYPQAAEAVVKGILAGDVAKMGTALQELGTGLSTGQVLNELAYGVNYHEVRMVVEDFTFVLGRGTLVARDSAVRFAAEVGNLGAVFPDDMPDALAEALTRFGVQQVYQATGVIDESGFEIRIVADLTVGPLVLEGAGFLLRYRNGDWTVEIDQPSISFDFLGWLESLKDFLGCDFSQSAASCSVGGVPVGSIAFDTSGGRVKVSMEATLPGNMGKVMFSSDVSRNGEFVFTGQAVVPLSAVQNLDATLVLTDDGVRAIGTIADISTAMTFDGTIWFDGSFVLSGLGSMTVIQFIEMEATGSVSFCPSGSKCAQDGNPVGDFVMLVAGEVNTPVGEATLQGELVYEGSRITYDLQGLAEFDVGGFAGLDGTMRVTNRGTPGGYLNIDLDLPLVTGAVNGELFADGSFELGGAGNLKIPGFANLATATIDISSARGVEVASRLGVAGAELAFSGRIGPTGFAFTGRNNIQLLGFSVDGQVNFAGNTSGASFGFFGGLFLGTTRIEVIGQVQSSGQFSFTGASTIRLFNYNLSNAVVTFDNTGLSVAGKMSILNLAEFDMSGRIESDLDFSLSAGARTVNLPGGLSGELGASLTKDGAYVRVSGNGHANFLGRRANGGFSVDSMGRFEFFGGFEFDWSEGNLSVDGDVRLSVRNSGFSASAHGRACADFAVDKGCAGVGGAIDSSGRVCFNFPIAGNKCLSIL